MQETPEFARLREFITPEVVKELAILYDRAVNSLDPHSPLRVEAERLFSEELRGNYDLIVASVPPPLRNSVISGELLSYYVVGT
jgi:hypothetical protein